MRRVVGVVEAGLHVVKETLPTVLFDLLVGLGLVVR